jgi:hypothetical protein
LSFFLVRGGSTCYFPVITHVTALEIVLKGNKEVTPNPRPEVIAT